MIEIKFAGELVRAVSDTTRSGILAYLSVRARTSEALAEKTGVAHETLASHLSILEKAGLVIGSEGEGSAVWGINPRMRAVVENYLQNADARGRAPAYPHAALTRGS